MLTAGTKGEHEHGHFCLLGLAEANIRLLKAGRPIHVDLSRFGLPVSGELAVMYGVTEADMELVLREAGLIGEPTSYTTDPRNDQEAAARAEHEHILIATCGLPRSGKSTWAQRSSYPVVCPDAIRLALHGQRFASQAEPFVWAIAKVMVRALFGAGHKTVVLDATNTTRVRRDEWRSASWGLFFKEFPATPAECLARIGEDAELRAVCERMQAAWEPLAQDELQWP